MTIDNAEYLTLQQVADLLQIDVRDVRQYIKDGKIPAKRFSKKITRIRKQDIEFLFEKGSE